MLLVLYTQGKKYIKSVDTLDESILTDYISNILHKDISHNIEGKDAVLDEEYEIYETEFVDDPGDSEDEPIGSFHVTNLTLSFDGNITHTEF